MREFIFDVIELDDDNDIYSKVYDVGMIITITLSLIPLIFKQEPKVFLMTDKVIVVIFIIDYFLRWMTADYLFKKKSAVSFIRYPFSIMALVDLISILPSVFVWGNGLQTLRMFRIIRALKVFRVFKTLRYSKSIQIIRRVISKTRNSLIAVCFLSIGYVLISALIIFNVEPATFDTFFDAVYWATVSLTTIGYGDIYPVSTLGRLITMISSFLGIAVVALPAGIITAGYMSELQNKEDEI